ncbi:MAG: sigma-70 family RNA polymerase sigma factor [Turicibacter sp.]|nr:sigma-70 family RNA polymerase sigma factor [Turicibacter sp.]
MEDRMIIDLYVKRSEEAISVSAQKYGNYCFTISNNILKSAPDAQECVNDTYLKAWNNIPPTLPVKLRTFLGRITRNLSLDRYKFNRTKKREGSEFELLLSELEDCVSSQMDVEKEVDANVVIQLINDWLLAQPLEQRTLFTKRYWHAASITDLASKYHMSDSKVKSMLFRLRKSLKIHLEKEGVEV